MLRDEKIFKYSIAIFFGFMIGALFWSFITYHIMKARFYDDLKAEQVEILERFDVFEKRNPNLNAMIEHVIWGMDDFEERMNKRTKLITKDMPSEVIVGPSEEN